MVLGCATDQPFDTTETAQERAQRERQALCAMNAFNVSLAEPVFVPFLAHRKLCRVADDLARLKVRCPPRQFSPKN
jgi:hypothetical protein